MYFTLQSLIIVLDTCALISDMEFIEDLRDQDIEGKHTLLLVKHISAFLLKCWFTIGIWEAAAL